MRLESHRQLGRHLAGQYLSHLPQRHIRAFLIGCTQPDRNPATYLKGSLRAQWLRGHNYRNARRFMGRISRRLERKAHWHAFDYYTLGKLIHYTADAFTQAHNESFSPDLAEHRAYEAAFQEHFLRYLKQDPRISPQTADSVITLISRYHREYRHQTPAIETDSHFVLRVCSCVLAGLVV